MLTLPTPDTFPCLALVLSGSSSLFSLAPSPWLSSPWFLVLPGLSPGPVLLSLLLLDPFLSGSFSNLFFWSNVGNTEGWGKGEGKGDEEGRGVDAMGYASTYLSQSMHISSPPYSRTYEL